VRAPSSVWASASPSAAGAGVRVPSEPTPRGRDPCGGTTASTRPCVTSVVSPPRVLGPVMTSVPLETNTRRYATDKHVF
jgi:hypothetical protein